MPCEIPLGNPQGIFRDVGSTEGLGQRCWHDLYDFACLERVTHCLCTFSFHTPYLDFRFDGFDCDNDSRDQSAATDADEDIRDFRQFLKDLKPDRAVASHLMRVVPSVKEGISLGLVGFRQGKSGASITSAP